MSDCDCQEPCENHPAFLDGATAPGTDGPSAPQEGCPHCGLLTCWEWRAKQAEGKLRRMEGMYHDAVERGALAESEALASHSLSLGGEDKEERGPYADDGNCCQWCGWMTCAGLEGCHGRGGRTEPEDKVEGEGRRSASGVADADLVRVGDFFGIPAFTHPDVKPGIVGIVSAGEVTAVIADREEPTPYAKAFRERVCPVPEFPSVGTAPQEAQADPKKGQGFGGYDASKARNRDLPVPDEAEGDGTGDEKLGSAPGPAGTPSRRHYTQREVAAAKRLGLADGKLTKLAGPIFWAGGDHYPNLVRQNAADYKLLAAAMEREWSKYANES